MFTIPRVGKSVEMDRREVEEDEYNFTSQDDLADDDNNDNNTNDDDNDDSDDSDNNNDDSDDNDDDNDDSDNNNDNNNNNDDSSDNDNNDNNDNLRSTDAQRRNVFSKIPRVGRSRVGRSRGDRRPWSSYVGPNDTF